MNLLINIVYYVYIDIHCNIHNYIRNQEIRVAMLCFFNVFFWLKKLYSYTERTQQKRQRKQYKTKQTKETMYSEQLYTIAILATNKSNQAVELILLMS